MGKKKGKKRSGSIDQAFDSVKDGTIHTSPHAQLSKATSTSVSTSAVSTSAATKQTTAIESNYPNDEDLSMQRHDEETVLSAIYGDDFTLEEGAWHCPLYKLRIRPPSDITDNGMNNININKSCANQSHNPNQETQSTSCELTLQIQLNRKYPYSVPLLQITNVIGISTTRIADLFQRIQNKAKECAEAGTVMGWELGQVVEEYLVEYMEKMELEREQRKRDLVGMYKVGGAGVDDDVGDEGDSSSHASENENPSSPGRDKLDSDIEKEVARQMEALDVAAQMRKRRRSFGILPLHKEEDEIDDDANGYTVDDDDFLNLSKEYNLDLDMPTSAFNGEGGDQQATPNFSRYQTDFVELAPLGRGGGGEVVQAINRLDRRIYAIKRIILESEDSHWAKVQNEKLRREVTTISRMTHKNIVRYYQAWVEGGRGMERAEEGSSSDVVLGENETVNNEDTADSKAKNSDSSNYSWDSSSSSSASTPDSDSSSNFSDDDEEDRKQQSNHDPMTHYSRSLSLDNFLEHEINNDFANPLLYYQPPIPESSQSSSKLPASTVPSHSQSQSDQRVRHHSDLGRKTLYIQVIPSGWRQLLLPINYSFSYAQQLCFFLYARWNTVKLQ